MTQQLSIIIPIFNEADTIEELLIHLIKHSSKSNIAEIIIVDGGSTDGSLDIVNNFHADTSNNVDRSRLGLDFMQPEILSINSPKGRAKQMNKGALKAKGSILYFLHADSFPPKDFDQSIINNVNNGNLAGCFRLLFDHKHWWLKLASWLTQFHWRACRGGDQSQFITKDLFNNIGGFDESYTIYEDNILINELYNRKQFIVINQKIKTSARLYEKHGIWRLQYHFWVIYIKKWFGGTADELYAYYNKHIA